MGTVGAYEAKTRLSELLDRVEAGERILVTRNGRPSAVMQPPAASRSANVGEVVAALLAFRRGRRLTAGEIRSMVEEGRP